MCSICSGVHRMNTPSANMRIRELLRCGINKQKQKPHTNHTNLIVYFKTYTMRWSAPTKCPFQWKYFWQSTNLISIFKWHNLLKWTVKWKKKCFGRFFEWKIIDCYMFFCINMDQAVYFWMKYMLICTFKFIWSNPSLISIQYFNWIGLFFIFFPLGKYCKLLR